MTTMMSNFTTTINWCSKSHTSPPEENLPKPQPRSEVRAAPKPTPELNVQPQGGGNEP